MELFRQLLVGMGLDTERFADGQHLEQEGETAPIALTDLCGHQSLVVLNEIEQGALSLDVFGGQIRMGAHP